MAISSLVGLTKRQRELLQFLAERDRVDVREINAAMAWSDDELRAIARPLITKKGLVTVVVTLAARVSVPSPTPEWWEITDRGRDALGLAPKPV